MARTSSRADRVVLVGLALLAGGLGFVAPLATASTIGVAVSLLWKPLGRIGVALAFAAAALGYVRVERAVHADDVARVAADRALGKMASCSARARVVGQPVRQRDALRWDAELRDLACDGEERAWRGRVTLYGGPEDLARGDELEVITALAPPQRFWNDDDPRPTAARRGVLRSGTAQHVERRSRGVGVRAWTDRARAHVRSRIDATFPPDVAPMARALVMGESDLSSEDDAAFRGSGLSHLLAVSGMHLVLVVVGFTNALRAWLARLEVLAARWDVGRIAALVGIPAAWWYADFAGGSGSAVRAAWMLTAALGARAWGRASDGPRAFGLSLVMQGIVDPLAAYDVSFLLSAAATGGLLYLARPLSEAASRVAPSWASLLVRSGSTTLAASIPCVPILARFAPDVALGGLFANVLAVPIGECAALPLCLVHAVLAPWPAAERGGALAASGALVCVRAIARTFAGLSFLSWEIPRPTAFQIGCLCIAAAIFVGVRRRRRAPLLLVTAAAALVGELRARHDGAPRAILRATFLDVGQGDAAIVDLPNGEAMVIDGGGLVGSPLDTGERVLAPALRARRRREVAAVVLSHPHPDHAMGLVTGLARVHVRAFWDTGQGEQERMGGAYAALLSSLVRRGIPVWRPDALCGPARPFGGAVLEVLAPCPAPDPDRGPNDNSFVVRLTYGSRAFLFVGDAEREEEAELLRRGRAALRADVLKVGHHGSRTSSSAPFLAAVSPEHAVISAGVRNRFGHPHATTLRALRAVGARVWRTDQDGLVIAGTDGDALEVRSARSR